jgi:hypothetical protein
MDSGHTHMLTLFEEEGYAKKQVQRIAWNLRKEGFPASAKFIEEIAQLMEEDNGRSSEKIR